ncbi:hypothetical protein L1987_85903 [Smallanthus sonchifolius]|uniref:Uncharacterized protein n=1 Tax=Smallanthus sonchifolius TaxID=185202 RepID=A0ACB8XXW2_9ASTR|nr:hypothetical protein L1987_85903 [Smallanthus sonchifolius]
MESFLVRQDIKRDLLLLENQIPVFILEILFGLTVKQILNYESLTGLLFHFFKDMHILISKVKICNEPTEHYHILEFFHSCYKPTATKSGPVPTRTYSATKLAIAGVRFKEQSNLVFPLTVNFKQSPLPRQTSLEIPVLHIENSTPSILKNMIAYEQLSPLSRQYVTSFAFLLDTDDDVSLLVNSQGTMNPTKYCYAPSFTNYDDLKWVEMMVIHGCFIFESLYKFKHGKAKGDPISEHFLEM